MEVYMATYGLNTGYTPVPGCFMCPDNHLLGFEPWALPGVGGFVVPGSWLVGGNLVPIPFTALAVPFGHPVSDSDGFGYTFPDTWPATFRRLLTLLPDFNPGDPWSAIHQVGFTAGARIPPAVKEAGVPAHSWEWVVWGRDKLRELSDEAALRRLGALETANLGHATIILRSRQAAGSLPSDRQLRDLWLTVQNKKNPIALYHQELLGLAT
jgi:hypothetical protein